MSFPISFTTFSLVGVVPAFILLIFPRVNYIVKAISVTLITIYLGYISRTLFAWNAFAYSSNDSQVRGTIMFVTFFYGLAISTIGGAIALAIFIAKNDKSRKIVSRIFKLK